MAVQGFHEPVVSTTRVLVGTVVVCAALIAGCGNTFNPRTATTTTTTSNLTELEQAQETMRYFNLEIPADAQQVNIIKPPLGDYRAKAVVSFVAPRSEVMEQTCRNISLKRLDRPPMLAGMDEPILKEAGVTLHREDFGHCEQYERGRNITVLIPKIEGAATYVILYHFGVR